jgi:6-pyruvoyltetrahydropterin/6-carboxytetrahydropterin synthase
VTWRISKDFTFSASHQLRGLPEGHQCARLHGHNYVVRVTLAADQLDDTGFVVDYGQLAPFGAWIDANLDHKHLNDLIPFTVENPTAEHLAVLLAAAVHEVVPLPAGVRVEVAVSETPKTWATWSPT